MHTDGNKDNSTKVVESCAKTMLKAHQYRKYKEVYQANMTLGQCASHIVQMNVINACGFFQEFLLLSR